MDNNSNSFDTLGAWDAGSYTMGGLIHILLVVAVIVLIVRLIQGRKVI